MKQKLSEMVQVIVPIFIYLDEIWKMKWTQYVHIPVNISFKSCCKKEFLKTYWNNKKKNLTQKNSYNIL